MSQWYHQMVFEDGTIEDLKKLNVYESRDHAAASADNFCIGCQAAFDEGKNEHGKRVAKFRVLRFSDNWCYFETDGQTMIYRPNGPDPEKPK